MSANGPAHQAPLKDLEAGRTKMHLKPCELFERYSTAQLRRESRRRQSQKCSVQRTCNTNAFL